MKYLATLLLLLSCQVQFVPAPQPESFWCVDRYTECIGDGCPFHNYYAIGHDDCYGSQNTCEARRQEWLTEYQSDQGVEGWYYRAECYRRYLVYCFRGPLPGDPEYCWESHYSCEVERYDNMLSQCYRASR